MDIGLIMILSFAGLSLLGGGIGAIVGKQGKKAIVDSWILGGLLISWAAWGVLFVMLLNNM